MESHIEEVLVPVYKQRAASLRRAVEEHLCPLGVQIDPDVISDEPSDTVTELTGGFFMYLLFPDGVLADEVAAISLERYNVKFLAAGAMSVRGSNTSTDRLRRGTRLCWAWEEEESQIEGVRRIALALSEVKKEPSKENS